MLSSYSFWESREKFNAFKLFVKVELKFLRIFDTTFLTLLTLWDYLCSLMFSYESHFQMVNSQRIKTTSLDDIRNC